MSNLHLTPDQVAFVAQRATGNELSRWLALADVPRLCADWQALHADNATLRAALRDLLDAVDSGLPQDVVVWDPAKPETHDGPLEQFIGNVVHPEHPAVIAARGLVGGADGG